MINHISKFYNSHKDFTNVLILTLVTAAVFFNSSWSYYLAFDDFNWPAFYNKSISEILFSESLGVISEGNYRPIELISHKVDNFIFGSENTFWKHLINIIFHIINVVLIYFLSIQLSANRVIGFIAALIFSIHFIHSYGFTPVSWITGRVEPIITIFFLSSFYLFVIFLKNRNKLIYFISLFLFYLALLTKEMAVTLPLILVLYIFLFRPNEGKEELKTLSHYNRILLIVGILSLYIVTISTSILFSSHFGFGGIFDESNNRMIKYLKLILIFLSGFSALMSFTIYFINKQSDKFSILFLKILSVLKVYYNKFRFAIPYFVILCLYLLSRFIALRGIGGNYNKASFVFQLDAFARDLYALIGFVLPVGIEYNNHIFYLQIEFPFLFYLLALILLLLLAFTFYRLVRSKSKLLIFSFLWIFVTLIPVHNIILPLHQYQQRYIYLPLVGFCLFISALFIENKYVVEKRPITILSVAFLTCILFYSAYLIQKHHERMYESGKVSYAIQKNMNAYRHLDLENANLYFISLPMDPMNSTSSVFLAAGYLNGILQYENKKYNQHYNCNIMLFAKDGAQLHNIKWIDETKLILSGSDLSNWYIIPHKLSRLDEERNKIYGRIPHALIKPLSSIKGITEVRLHDEDSSSVASVNLLRHDKDLKNFELEVEIMNTPKFQIKKSLFFMYKDGEYELIKQHTPSSLSKD